MKRMLSNKLIFITMSCAGCMEINGFFRDFSAFSTMKSEGSGLADSPEISSWTRFSSSSSTNSAVKCAHLPVASAHKNNPVSPTSPGCGTGQKARKRKKKFSSFLCCTSLEARRWEEERGAEPGVFVSHCVSADVSSSSP